MPLPRPTAASDLFSAPSNNPLYFNSHFSALGLDSPIRSSKNADSNKYEFFEKALSKGSPLLEQKLLINSNSNSGTNSNANPKPLSKSKSSVIPCPFGTLSKRTFSFTDVEDSIFFSEALEARSPVLPTSFKLPFPFPHRTGDIPSSYSTKSIANCKRPAVNNKQLGKSRALSAFSANLLSLPEENDDSIDGGDSNGNRNSVETRCPQLLLAKRKTRPTSLKRTLSQSSASILTQSHAFTLTQPMEIECASPSNREASLIPSHTLTCDPIRRISNHTMAGILSGEYADLYDELLVIDCRFPYEYNGGHIQDARNINSTEHLDTFFFGEGDDNREMQPDKRYLLIFHCEYSIKRAPSMANYLRKRDREVNALNYPKLHYPEVYVLQGGYCNFYSNHKLLCNPSNYVTMDDANHCHDLKAHFSSFERQHKHKRPKCTSALNFDTLIQSPTNSLRICRSNSANISTNLSLL